jgi:hypothetical protein
MPLVGGELARAAFENGFEEYGVAILKQYYNLITEKGETYLWYFPDGRHSSVETSTSPEATPTDGWGSGAMLYALIEGLAGVKDRLKGFKDISLSPRWEAAGVKEAEVMIDYPASGSWVKYKYLKYNNLITFVLEGSPEHIDLDLFLPGNIKSVSASINGADIKSFTDYISGDKYFRCSIMKLSPSFELTLTLSGKSE